MKRLLILFIYISGFPGIAFAEDLPDKELTISEAISLALINHPTLREASERERGAKAVVDDIRSTREFQLKAESRHVSLSDIPTISTLPKMPQISLGQKNSWTSTLTAQKVLSSGGRIEAAVRQSKSAAAIAGLSTRRLQQVVAFEAERSFLQLVLAQRELEVASQAFDTASEYLRVANSRFESKSAAKFDVLRAEVQREEARQDIIRAQSAIQTTHASLIQALALKDGSFVATETGIVGSFTTPSLDDALQKAREQRPELKSSDWQITAAKAGISAAKGEIRPTISVIADYQKNDPETAMQIDRWSTVIAAGIPLIDGGHYRAKMKSAKAQLSQQCANQENLQNQVEKEVRQAYARLNSAASQVEVAQKRVEFADEMVRITHVRYSSGMSTATEVADAQTSLTRARQGLIRAVSDLRIAGAELRLATGAPPNLTMTDTQGEK